MISGNLPGSGKLTEPYRVLDITDEKGCLAGRTLAEFGADVVKIEPPGGDRARDKGPFFHNIVHREKSLFWASYNLGKRGITLNIETKEGRDILKRLAARSDVLVESYAPGYMDSLGLSYGVLHDISPRLVMCSISPFGQSGPYRNYKVSNLVAMALSGIMSTMGDPDRAPLAFDFDISSLLASLQAVMGTLIALHQRETTGEGQYIDVSIQESVATVLEPRYKFMEHWSEETGRRKGQNVSRNEFLSIRYVWPCKDGYISWRLFTAAMGSKTEALVRIMAGEGMAGELEQVDWKSLDFAEIKQDYLDHLQYQFARYFLAHTKAELQEKAKGKDVMLFPVCTSADLMADEQLASRSFWTHVEQPEPGADLTYPGLPYKLNPELPQGLRRAPLIGEHNREVYAEIGLAPDDLVILKHANIL